MRRRSEQKPLLTKSKLLVRDPLGEHSAYVRSILEREMLRREMADAGDRYAQFVRAGSAGESTRRRRTARHEKFRADCAGMDIGGGSV